MALLDVWRRQLRAQARAHKAQREATRRMVEAAWRKLPDPYDPKAEADFAVEAGQAIGQGRRAFADVTLFTLRETLKESGIRPPQQAYKLPEQPRGISVTEEMLRATKQARALIAKGKSPEAAMKSGLHRALTIADMDLAVAGRDAFAATIANIPEVIGTRRDIHPELSESGVCGLCIAAATRIYSKRGLMPLHAYCKCEPVPVLRDEEDFAQLLNGQTLEELYIQIGLTKREDLVNVRVKVEENSEVGPLLVAGT